MCTVVSRAMILDHVLGATAHQPGRPAYTGTLTLRYHQRTPLLQPLRADAWVDRVEGVKTFAVGQISGAAGVPGVRRGHFHPPAESARVKRNRLSSHARRRSKVGRSTARLNSGTDPAPLP